MLVVLLGIDGAGKSTAAQMLRDRVLLSGRRALLLQNHSGRRTISNWCADHHVRLHPGLADLLETAVRVGHVLLAHLRAHRFDGLVLMDRHLHCQLALRAARGLPHGRLLPRLLRHLPQPDLVILFALPPRRAWARIKQRGTDKESLQFLEAFSAAYCALPEYPTFVTAAAGGTPTETTNQLAELLVGTSMVDQVIASGSAA
jgi:dTMP kinase